MNLISTSPYLGMTSSSPIIETAHKTTSLQVSKDLILKNAIEKIELKTSQKTIERPQDAYK